MQRYATMTPFFATLVSTFVYSSALAGTTVPVTFHVDGTGGWLKTTLSIPVMSGVSSTTTPTPSGSLAAEVTIEHDSAGNPILVAARVLSASLDMTDGTFNLTGPAVQVTTTATHVGATAVQHAAVRPFAAAGAFAVPLSGTSLTLNRGTVHSKGMALRLPLDLTRNLSTEPITGEFRADSTAAAKLTPKDDGYEIDLLVPVSMQMDVLAVPARAVFGLEGEIVFSGFAPMQ